MPTSFATSLGATLRKYLCSSASVACSILFVFSLALLDNQSSLRSPSIIALEFEKTHMYQTLSLYRNQTFPKHRKGRLILNYEALLYEYSSATLH